MLLVNGGRHFSLQVLLPQLLRQLVPRVRVPVLRVQRLRHRQLQPVLVQQQHSDVRQTYIFYTRSLGSRYRR